MTTDQSDLFETALTCCVDAFLKSGFSQEQVERFADQTRDMHIGSDVDPRIFVCNLDDRQLSVQLNGVLDNSSESQSSGLAFHEVYDWDRTRIVQLTVSVNHFSGDYEDLSKIAHSWLLARDEFDKISRLFPGHGS